MLELSSQYELNGGSQSSLLAGLQQNSKALFGFNDASGFIKYSSIPDITVDHNLAQKNPPRPNQPKPPPPGSKGDVGLSGTTSVLKLSISALTVLGIPIRLVTPLIRVRRNDALWDMVSPSVAFWDT